MQINAPLIITPSLLPGMRIGNSWVSLDSPRAGESGTLVAEIVLSGGGEYRADGFRGAPAHGGRFRSPEDAMETVLAFMSAAAEARAGSDNAGLFEPDVMEWCRDNSEAIQCARMELESPEAQ